MDFKHLSNDELHSKTLAAAQKERLSTVEVLWHLREVERRMLYAEKGYRDLKEYCVRELKYSEGSAWRRIAAMKLLKEVPEVQQMVQTGDLNLTQLTLARTHFREVKASTHEKKEVLSSLVNQNTKKTERILAELKPEPPTPKPDSKEKPMKGQRLEVTLILDEELQNEIAEIQVLMGKPVSKLELFKMLTKEKLQSLKKPSPVRKRRAQPPRSTNAQKTRYISKFTLRAIRARDQHRCQYFDPKTQQQCTSQYHLQTEHITPFAKGGKNNLENLQLLCPTHNRFRAVQQFGETKMSNYLPSIQS